MTDRHRFRQPDRFRSRPRERSPTGSDAVSSTMALRSLPITAFPQELIDDAEAKAKAFFALPEEVKRRYALGRRRSARLYPVRDRDRQGALGRTTSRSSGTSGRELPNVTHMRRWGWPPNVWPQEVAGFRETLLRAIRKLRQRRPQTARGHRPLPQDRRRLFPTTPSRDGNSVLRLLHYPPQTEPTGEHIRAGAHEDINAITLLLGAEEAGLELLTATAAGSRCRRRRASWSSTSATCFSG